jgi:hypothetical protein
MADDLIALQAQLASLKSARASGVRTSTFGERSVTRATDKELVAAIAALENEIAAMAGTPRPKSVVMRGGKGW